MITSDRNPHKDLKYKIPNNGECVIFLNSYGCEARQPIPPRKAISREYITIHPKMNLVSLSRSKGAKLGNSFLCKATL